MGRLKILGQEKIFSSFLADRLQSLTCNLDNSTDLLEKLIVFFTDYRETGLPASESSVANMCDELEVTKEYPVQRVRRKRTLFSYEATDEPVQAASERFRVDFVLPLVDAALTTSRERFHILDKHNKLLGFLCNVADLSQASNDDLQTKLYSHYRTFIPTPIPIAMIWSLSVPFPWKSHGIHGIPIVPIPMHIYTVHIRSPHKST